MPQAQDAERRGAAPFSLFGSVSPQSETAQLENGANRKTKAHNRDLRQYIGQGCEYLRHCAWHAEWRKSLFYSDPAFRDHCCPILVYRLQTMIKIWPHHHYETTVLSSPGGSKKSPRPGEKGPKRLLCFYGECWYDFSVSNDCELPLWRPWKGTLGFSNLVFQGKLGCTLGVRLSTPSQF